MNIRELLKLYKCNCGRSWCDFFNPAEEDKGISYTREEVEKILRDLPKVEKHLRNLLNDPKNRQKTNR